MGQMLCLITGGTTCALCLELGSYNKQITGQQHHRLITIEEMIPSYTRPTNGNWTLNYGSELLQRNTASNYASRELCDAIYRDVPYCQSAINSYFKWLMTLPICYSTVKFPTARVKPWPSTLLISAAWKLGSWRILNFTLFTQPFLASRLKWRLEKRSQKQHKE